MNKIKSKILTRLFTEWVTTELDLETLELSKVMIQSRQDLLNNRVRVIGFKYNNQDNEYTGQQHG